MALEDFQSLSDSPPFSVPNIRPKLLGQVQGLTGAYINAAAEDNGETYRRPVRFYLWSDGVVTWQPTRNG